MTAKKAGNLKSNGVSDFMWSFFAVWLSMGR
jgi:hypothetical protein